MHEYRSEMQILSQLEANVTLQCSSEREKNVVKKLVTHNELRWKISVGSVRSAVGKMMIVHLSICFPLEFPRKSYGLRSYFFFFVHLSLRFHCFKTNA